MDSITHALYKAISADDAHQRRIQAIDTDKGGLRPIATRQHVHQAYADAAPTDLHIALTHGPELLALQLELIAGGYCPPAGLVEDGAEVIISPGRVDVYAATDKGDATWTMILAKASPNHRGDRRATWEEQVS